MTTTRPRPWFAAAAAAAAVVSLAAPAHAAPGIATVGTAYDASHDSTRTGDAKAADAQAFDITKIAARQRLEDDGRLFYEAAVTIADASRTNSMDNVRVAVHIDVTGDQPGHATAVGNSTKPEAFLVNGKTIVCQDMGFSVADGANQLIVRFPAACVPGTGQVSMSATVTAGTATGNGSVTDAVSGTAPGTVGIDKFRTAKVIDDTDDITYLVDPATNRYMARSGDLRTVGAAVDAEAGTVTVTASVLDLSRRTYDPDQRFTLRVTSSDKTLATWHVRNDPAQPGKPIAVTGAGACGATATFSQTANKVTFDIPRSCLGEVKTAAFTTISEVLDAGTVVGRDVADATRIVALS